MDNLPGFNPSRRGSLSLLSSDLPPPPPADLERIHASSSQSPGLTSFGLSSPSSGVAEPLSLNRLYSRVKSVASSVRGIVGGGGSGRLGAPAIVSERYWRNSDSHESFGTAASDEATHGSSGAAPDSAGSGFWHRKQPFAPRPGSGVSSDRSTKSGPWASKELPPAFLRKTSVLPAKSAVTTHPSVAPVTVFRDGSLDDASERPASIISSHNDSASNLQSVASSVKEDRAKTVPALRSSGIPKPTVHPLLEPAGASRGDDGFSDAGSLTDSKASELPNDVSFVDDEDYDDSGTDELSDSSDDDVVLLNTKLPGAGTIRGRPSAKNGANAEKNRGLVGPVAGNSTIERAVSSASTGQIAAPVPKDGSRPPATSGSGTSGKAPEPFVFPSDRTKSTNPAELSVSLQSDSNPPHGLERVASASSQNMRQSASLATVNVLPVSNNNTGGGKSKDRRPAVLAKLNTDQRLLLPGFKITREPSSGTDSSHAGTVAAEGDRRDGTTSSVYRQGFDDDDGDVRGIQVGTGSSEAVSQALRQLRKGTLTRDFWMKDEVCKDCFLCGSTFSAWRRKHHCRLCGQIFCSKCTTLIAGEKFGHQGSMRVCSPCLDIVNGYQDDSESDGFSSSSFFDKGNPRSAGIMEPPTTPAGPSSSGFNMPRDLRPSQTPLMAIPATRTMAGNNPNRRSQILEINAADLPSPPRPTSSRSVKTFTGLSRPATAGSTKALLGQHPHPHQHRHQHSRSVHKLVDSASVDERAPFHRNVEKSAHKSLPAFHADSIIDPDLAPYMSDYDGSDDEQMSIFATMVPKPVENLALHNASGMSTPTGGVKSEKPGSALSNAAKRRGKSRSAGSMHAILGLEGSGSKSGIHPSRSSRRRNTGLGILQPRPHTRGKNRGIMRAWTESIGGPLGISGPATPGLSSPRASRSASMRGPLAPTVELNSASLEHVRKLLKQLLQDSDIRNPEKWEKALMPILLKSTDDLNPDIRAGDDIDIRHYVKVKRIPGGKPCDTSYISGVVFTKNLALKSMSRNISQPRIVVVTFPIEYQRHQQQLMSLEPVIAQEREFLQNMVNRIVALRPSLLLVEKNISGLALQLLAQAKVATAYLVKPSVIEAVARCAQADIFSSIDKLALSNFRLGRCQKFDVKTFVHDDIPGHKKTFMYLSGCPKELGCTIVLRGADMATLAVVKQITELMIYVVYNLKLETCLMRDEFVQIPSSPTSAAPAASNPEPKISEATPANGSDEPKDQKGVPEKEPENMQQPAGAETTTENSQASVEENVVEDKAAKDNPADDEVVEKKDAPKPEAVSLEEDRLPDDIPSPTYYEDMIRKHETKILSASPFVRYMQPYLLTRARGLERKLTYLRQLRDELATKEQAEESAEVASLLSESVSSEKADPVASDQPPEPLEKEPKTPELFQLVKPELLHSEAAIKGGTKKMIEALKAIYDSEYDKALHVYETQKKQWENYLAQYDDLFDPFAHQSIAVLYSMVCTATTVPCEGPEIRRLEFYYQNMDLPLEKSDASLGQYVEYLCDTADHTCTAVSCDKKMLEHHRSYVHGQARVSVLVSDKIACPIKGMQNTILMWSYCKICPNANTPAIPMSESSWKYSFGKYLELTFWSSDMKLRAGTCPHDLNRDHVRCFGYRGLTVVFQYDPIELLEIVVPRTKITYKPEIDLRNKNEQYLQNEEKIKRFFASVKTRLRSIRLDSVPGDKLDACKAEIETLVTNAEASQTWLISKLQQKYNKSRYYEIIPLNRALRALQESVVEWDSIFATFDSNYFPSEKDIRRLATLQLKRLFLDQPLTPSYDNDPTPTQEKTEGGSPPSMDGAIGHASPDEMSSEHAHEMLASVVQEHQGSKEGEPMPSPARSEHSLEPSGDSVPTTPSGPVFTLTDDDATPRQELPAEKAMSDLLETTAPASRAEAVPETPAGLESDIRSQSSPTLQELSAPLADNGKLPPEKKPLRQKPSITHMSSIPRLDSRRKVTMGPPPLSRTASVPDVPRQRKDAVPKLAHQTATLPLKKPSDAFRGRSTISSKAPEKMTDKFRLSTLSKKPGQRETQIPRSVPGLVRQNSKSKVSSLAKHFDQLSKEFERERIREKRQLAAKRTRALPVATSRPIVEVYRNVTEAVEEATDDEDVPATQPPQTHPETESSESTVVTPSEPTAPDKLPTEEDTVPLSQSQSDADASDGEISMTSDHEILPVPPTLGAALPSSTDTSSLNISNISDTELPKHKSTWVKVLSNFWAERSASGWTALEYPLHPTDHVFNDSDIIVREDEPSSLIAFALNCQDYAEKLEDIRHSDYSHIRSSRPASSEGKVHKHSFNVEEHPELERSLLKTTGTHLKYQFQEGSARMFCKIFYAEQFDALRRNCGVADRYVESLSRCVKWDSKGGKTKSLFLKTYDERIVLKQLSPIETTAFIKFAPAYFQFMSEAFFHELPTVIAKMLGFYQIFIKNPSTGTEIKLDILVMENLFYDRKTTRIFDLKGSMRNRYMQATGEQNEVLLDENMVEFIYESPLFVREHSKKLLRASLWNDTLFLSRQNVMDYSLMVGIDEEKKELVVGIIDCIRTFTWDKKLENWVKKGGFAGGGKNQTPTVVSPREYKHRFREAMERYFLEAPSCWHLFRMNYMGAVPLQLHNTVRESTGVISPGQCEQRDERITEVL